MDFLKMLGIVAILGLFFQKKSNAQDWPNLERYRAENAHLEMPKEGEKRVVFMGNSITEGWPNSFFENRPYINRGVSGQTTPQMVLRFRQDVIDLNPKVVVILAGTNDIAGNTGPMTLEQIRDNMQSMVELAQANDIIPIVCSVLPAYDYPWRPGLEPNIKIPKLNGMLKTMAAEKEVHYLDYFSAMADDRNGLPKELASDEVHPTPKGYSMMAPIVEKAIRMALEK